jgi:uncharacterized protein (DUF2345 family)
MLAARPLCIYNTAERHWRQYSPETPRRPIIVKAASHVKAEKLKAEVEIEQLKLELKKHREAEQKIKRHAKWMLRSTQSAHKDAQDVIEIIKDLYGDDAFE